MLSATAVVVNMMTSERSNRNTQCRRTAPPQQTSKPPRRRRNSQEQRASPSAVEEPISLSDDCNYEANQATLDQWAGSQSAPDEQNGQTPLTPEADVDDDYADSSDDDDCIREQERRQELLDMIVAKALHSPEFLRTAREVLVATQPAPDTGSPVPTIWFDAADEGYRLLWDHSCRFADEHEGERPDRETLERIARAVWSRSTSDPEQIEEYAADELAAIDRVFRHDSDGQEPGRHLSLLKMYLTSRVQVVQRDQLGREQTDAEYDAGLRQAMEYRRRIEDIGTGRGRPWKMRGDELIRDHSTPRPAVIGSSECTGPGLIRERQIAMMASMTKVKKSWATNQLAGCIVSGEQWLGHPVRQGDALLVDTELDQDDIGFRMAEIQRDMGLTDEQMHLIEVWGMRGQDCWISSLVEELEAMSTARLQEISILVVDAAYSFVEGDENNSQTWKLLIAPLQAFAARHNIAVVIVHHATKGDQSQKNVRDIGSGSGVLQRMVDCVIAIREHAEKDVYVMAALPRSFATPEPVCIKWEFPTMRLAPEYDPTELKKQGSPTLDTAGDRAAKELIMEMLDAPANREGVPAGRIRVLLGAGNGKVKRLLGQLEVAGRIRTTNSQRGNTAALYVSRIWDFDDLPVPDDDEEFPLGPDDDHPPVLQMENA